MACNPEAALRNGRNEQKSLWELERSANRAIGDWGKV